ncbi:MotA/TolQ/ExbB proton channel family protein [Pseudoalteromonas tunicata]|uniref:MotA/TolQ/ExbB proton channel family protein n=1 Tax=Pseudoalteromonas tunicata D2 TaxID=87626 RepID=A4C5R3_9GAMM|nr:MotA/TolQ/ExbB proton channel family protein [Pseudoalteromonas tunicata]ATC95292.1 biopolymer transport protein ExbB [Pseudoalteromonas tunicata]AXT30892.1 MotA/TolQ/ExbB proton channel family protein [Pseudoalteromonas tunicata]EAR29317.1 MotA/TolQ/ExbB proton channel family protein [Pseudoalteromonas tunicata D2]MDP4983224.1 MotA/TolQ/ExbB proton channel family protein [Pseudoalteromonas tunicata]MDP5213115.1 MotA/TolQ/ExbB proton channel family protein [Pseudoalteromonas tunicata]
MKKLFKGFAVAAVLSVSAGVALNAHANTVALDQILEQVKKDRISEGKINQQREQEFLSARSDKQALLNNAKRDLAAEKARGEQLKKQYAQNELTLASKEQELETAKGTLGEMFGVVRRAASETIGSIEASVVSAQFPNREEVLRSLAAAKELPTTRELEELWIGLQTEMTESAKVATFDVEVAQLDGATSVKSVTRIGTFNLVSEDGYLIYHPETKQVQPLGRQPDAFVTDSANALRKAAPGSYVGFYLDPTRGSILRLNTQKATPEDRFHQGGEVGYIIAVLLVIGFIIALVRLIDLSLVSSKMKSQLKNAGTPNTNNPLGRILKVYHDNKNQDVENLELKLDEAILRETPRIEAGINIIKIFAAIAPLLGLLGTVVGMIDTFQQITLFGTGDPKIMAGSISMALVTTALGLIAALPLILLHAVVHGRSKSIVHVLEEQSAGIIAAHAEKEKA